MTATLKEKEAALRNAEARVRQYRDEAAKAQRAMSAAEKDVERFRIEIANMPMQPRKPAISEHAILRYLERVMGLDIQGITEKIDTSLADAAYASGIRNGSFPTDKGCTMVMRNGVIVTVKP